MSPYTAKAHNTIYPVEMEVTVPRLEEAQVMELAEAAHKVCPYSKATRGNIEVTLKVRAPVQK
jgi:osmotically inducible protein OsmC